MILFVIVGLVLFGLAALVIARLDSRATTFADPTPDDLRRADDGRPDQPYVDYGNPMG